MKGLINIMFTITHIWINEKSLIPEAICRVSGLYETIEEARKGLHLWFMKVPNNGCEIFQITEDQYSFLSPNGKSRGFVEIQLIEE